MPTVYWTIKGPNSLEHAFAHITTHAAASLFIKDIWPLDDHHDAFFTMISQLCGTFTMMHDNDPQFAKGKQWDENIQWQGQRCAILLSHFMCFINLIN
jgi:hypothetical protein